MDIMQENERMRESLNMNINQYSKYLGINQPTYFRLLNGKAEVKNTTSKTLFLLLQVLDKNTRYRILDELMNEE